MLELGIPEPGAAYLTERRAQDGARVGLRLEEGMAVILRLLQKEKTEYKDRKKQLALNMT